MSDQRDSRQDSHKVKSMAIIAVLAIGVFAAALMASQALSPASAQTNDDADDDERSTISTTGIATTKVTPDKVSLTVGVETDGANATEAVSKNAELMENVISALKGLGITDDQISTGYFSVYPTYDYNYPPCILQEGGAGTSDGSDSTDPNSTNASPAIYPIPPECAPKNVITGYKASNSLIVTLEGNADVGEVIDTAVEAGANTINGAYFFVSQEQQEQIREGLIAEAIENARSRADKAASAVSLNVTGVKSINLNDVYFPIYNERFASADAGVAGSTPILPGEQEISMTVQVTYFMG